LSSPYTRAVQTADIVAGQLGLEVVADERLAPGFNLERLNEIVTRYPTAQALLLVGHEPTFSATITTLIGGGRLTLKKGALARVEITSFDPLSGELIWLVSPKILAD
jgi:phosphohistidine phosphatase